MAPTLEMTSVKKVVINAHHRQETRWGAARPMSAQDTVGDEGRGAGLLEGDPEGDRARQQKDGHPVHRAVGLVDGEHSGEDHAQRSRHEGHGQARRRRR